MRVTRSARHGGLIIVAACLLIPGSAAAFSGHVLRGFGTATIDGYMSPGEWDAAGRADFTMNRAPGYGGGTVPASIYVMNDAANLYIGIQVMNTPVGYSGATLSFDADHDDNSSELGEDVLCVSGDGTFYDRFDLQDQTSGRFGHLVWGNERRRRARRLVGWPLVLRIHAPAGYGRQFARLQPRRSDDDRFRLGFGSCSQPDSGTVRTHRFRAAAGLPRSWSSPAAACRPTRS